MRVRLKSETLTIPPAATDEFPAFKKAFIIVWQKLDGEKKFAGIREMRIYPEFIEGKTESGL